MKEKIIRILISIVIGYLVYCFGAYLMYTDAESGPAYVAAAIAVGAYWIGSKE